MRYGAAYGAPYGNPETWTIILGIVDFHTGAAVNFLSLYGQYYQLVIDGKNSGIPIFVARGTTTTLRGNYQGNSPHTISVIGVGPWAKAGFFDVIPVQSSYLQNRSGKIHFELLGTKEQFSENDNGQLTAWSVSGIQRFTNCRTVSNRPTIGELDVVMTTVLGAHTIYLKLGNNIVASGSKNSNGVVTLTEKNGSGICRTGTNTVTLAYTNDLPGTNPVGAKMQTSFPSEFRLYYRTTTPWSTFGTPTSKIFDDGRSSSRSFDSGPLPTGLYYCIVHEVNEDGNESTGAINQLVTINVVPASPGVPIYVSGDDQFYVIDDQLNSVVNDAAILVIG